MEVGPYELNQLREREHSALVVLPALRIGGLNRFELLYRYLVDGVHDQEEVLIFVVPTVAE